MEKICPRCGRPFECRHDDIPACECSRVTLSAKVRDYLKAHFQDRCLCKACLAEIVRMFGK